MEALNLKAKKRPLNRVRLFRPFVFAYFEILARTKRLICGTVSAAESYALKDTSEENEAFRFKLSHK